MAFHCLHLLLPLLLLLALPTGNPCDLGPPLLDCNGNKCSVYNSQGLWEDRSNCTVSAAFYPTTETELIEAVAWAVKKNLKIKVTSPLGHTRSPLMCAGNGHYGVIISTRDLNSKRSVDLRSGTVTVYAGVNMRQLQDAVGDAGVSFPTSTSWDGVSVGGALSTGAHGSGLFGKGSSIHEYVLGLRLVVPATAAEGHAKVVELTPTDDDFKAAVLSLGVLGAISEVTFSIQPLFKRSVTLSLHDDAGLEDRLVPFLNQTEFANTYWYVSQGKALMGSIDRVSVNTTGDGINKSSYQPTTVARVKATAKSSEEIEKNEDADLLCSNAETSMNNRIRRGSGFLNDGQNFTGFPVVGFNHKMVNTGGCQRYDVIAETNHSSECLPDKITNENQSICSWDRRTTPRQTWDFEFRVPLWLAPDAMRDVKKIREVSNVTRKALCSVEGSGMVIRTLRKSEAYLGPPEDAVTFGMTYYRSQQSFVPKWNMDVFTEIEQLLNEKYRAHLHWAKSGGYYFDGQAQTKTVNLDNFLEVRRRYDPQGLFLNQWAEKLLGIGGQKVEEVRDGCALEKLCKCSEHSHCAPSAGYFCRPGRVYTAARVCRKETSSRSS